MTKERLKNYLWIKKNIKNLMETLEEIESQGQIKSPTISDQPKTTIREFDKIGNVVARKSEIEETLKEKILEGQDVLKEIEECIETLPENERCLMRLRYIKGVKWEKICVEMNYSWSYLHSLHNKILFKIAD